MRVAGLRLQAPAKLNLYLAITGRRPDGYHELQSVLEPIDWCDALILYPAAPGRFERIGGLPEVPAEHDLSVRAARALAEAAGLRFGVRIVLDKQVPSGAGLGGGSGDAAAVLTALNRLWRLDWPLARLESIALSLGADVPAQLYGAPVYVRGIGERVEPIALPLRHYVVLFPGVACPTATMYAAPDLVRDAAPRSAAEWLAAPTYANAFQPVAEARHPAIRRAAEWLRQQFGEAVLSGSGSALWARVDDPERARALLARRPVPGQARLCRSWRGNLAGLNASA
jgi:4-diphosphocytidyl-2-C-methyl-D-erythritol kinase